MRTQRALLFLPALFLYGASSSSAQELVYLLGAEATYGDDFGLSVADAGDVDQDGYPDVIVGAPFDDANGTSSGSVFVYSGRTGGLIWTRAGEAADHSFGWAVDGVGDVNGDGASDVIVGAPLWDWPGGDVNGGKVYVLSGATGNWMTTFSVNQLNAQLGYTVRGLGDITGDGVGDYAFGSPFYDYNSLPDRGTIHVKSGVDSSHLFSRYGDDIGEKYGYSFDVVRATGNQATSRLIVGEPGVDGGGTDRGQARLMDGYGNTISYFSGSTDNEWTGACVAGLGDVNNDGWEDYAIGAPYADILFAGVDAGIVRVYSGASTSQMFSVTGPAAGARFGQNLAGFGDFNGDGRRDFLLGAPNHAAAGTESGEVRVVSGFNGGTLAAWTGTPGDHLGRSVSSAGDLNLDGIPDIIFGASDAPHGEGQAQVHLSGLAAPTIYCTAKVNSQGCTPRITHAGVASLSIANSFHVKAEDVLNQQFGLLFWARGAADYPFMGGRMCVNTPRVRTGVQFSGGSAVGSDCTGAYDFHFTHAYLSAAGILAGDRIHAQYWSRDPVASFGVGLTDAVAFDVVP